MRNFSGMKVFSVLLALVLLMTALPALASENGTYKATADGFGGPIEIEVTIADDAITEINVLSSSETLGIGEAALSQLPGEVIAAQSIGIDGLAGATFTSNAFFKMMEDALTQAGADVDAWKQPVEAEITDEEQLYECDVVVVGAGLSGLTAAASAQREGANVVALEKLAVTGGSAKASLGSFMICEVPENEGYHVTDEADTLDAALERWATSQANSVRESPYPDEDRLKSQLVDTMITVDWLTSFGATFTPKSPIAERGMAMLQGDVADAPEGRAAAKILNLLKETFIDNGGTLLLETPATGLIIDDNGAVIGVEAQSKQGPVKVYADSVILATGGFSQNPEMTAEMIPELHDLFTIASIGNTGDGIRMAIEAGAAPFEDAWVNPCWPSPSAEFYAANNNALVFQYSNSPLADVSEPTYNRLMVDANGKRFMNEAAHYSLQTLKIAYGDAPYYSIYSGLTGTAAEIAESGLVSGAVFKADSIAELAEQLGLDAATLEETVARYDEICAAGEDVDFGKDVAYLDHPVGETGPFYAIKVVPACSDTLGGVKTNDDRQVLKEDGSVLEGLFAVGACSNKYYYNQSYFSGSALTFSATDGRIAGACAAKLALEAKDAAA